jgi:hypothetical protein
MLCQDCKDVDIYSKEERLPQNWRKQRVEIGWVHENPNATHGMVVNSQEIAGSVKVVELRVESKMEVELGWWMNIFSLLL